MAKSYKKWVFIAVFLAVMFLIASFIAGVISLFMGAEAPLTGNVVIIPVKGIILADKASMYGQDVASAADIVKRIERADKAENVKAIIFEINSPGGSVVASEEIANAIKKANKTTVAYIREVGASGAYWAASAADYVFASRMSVTGSIGVVASYLEFSGFLQRYNITEQRLVSGKYKDIGSPFRRLTGEEEAILQKQVDLVHNYFIQDVMVNRNLPRHAIEEVSTAEIFLGVRAKELGLIDEFGGREEAVAYAEKRLGITADVEEVAEKKTLLELLSEVMNEKSFFVGEGIGSAFLAQKQVNSLKLWS